MVLQLLLQSHLQPLHRRQLRVAAPGQPVRTFPRVGTARLAFTSRPTASFTPWGAAAAIQQERVHSPVQYNPATNRWTAKSATYPDNHTNNMACGVLSDGGTPYIYCVGGSQVTVVDSCRSSIPLQPCCRRRSLQLLLLGPVRREPFCPVVSRSSITSSTSWVGSTPSRTEGKGQTRSMSLLLLPLGCQGPLFCLFR